MGDVITRLSGGCLCGQIRFTATAAPTNPHLCACRQCQRWSGAPVVGWVDFPIEAVTFDGPGGEPRWHRSSDFARRGFCMACGGTVCVLDDGAAYIGITTGCLDDPDVVAPVFCSFPEVAPRWLPVAALLDAGEA